MADDKGIVAVSQISCGSSHSCALLGTSWFNNSSRYCCELRSTPNFGDVLRVALLRLLGGVKTTIHVILSQNSGVAAAGATHGGGTVLGLQVTAVELLTAAQAVMPAAWGCAVCCCYVLGEEDFFYVSCRF